MKKNGIKLRIGNGHNGEQIFKTIISYPMETGYRIDKRTGENVPADYIHEFKINVDGESYVEMILGEYISKNPYLSFTFTKPVVTNQLMNISWTDTNGFELVYEFIIKMNMDGWLSFSGEKINTAIMKIFPQVGPICKTK